MKKNILLLCGGGSSEHEISLISARYIESCLQDLGGFEVLKIIIQANNQWLDENNTQWIFNGSTKSLEQSSDRLKFFKIDFAIPCIHGYPGETGDIQSIFEMNQLPYLGCHSETHKICFNKITTKLWAETLGVKSTPYLVVGNLDDLNQRDIEDFFNLHQSVVVKASNQGSSIGCYLVNEMKDLKSKIKQAFEYSPYVLIEKRLKARELEVSAYEFNHQVCISKPGEIICPSGFYSFEEKYSQTSQTKTLVVAENISQKSLSTIHDYSLRLFKGLKLRHLSRIDYLMENDQVYLNEINTFPGMTPISMFPKMMEANNHPFKDFLRQILISLSKHV